ncbi:MAG: hypothetical protein JNL98_32835 [Bryobacterales bacterium]|nr:hypothetical protein [Bryobacterales bacterium]
MSDPKSHPWRAPLLVALAIFAFNAALNHPLFRNGAQPYRGSIEAGYAGIARFFAENPNPWGWNPLVYCGLPTQFTYLPGAPYLAALPQWLVPSIEPLHAYRIVTATMACLGPVTLFLFAWYVTRSIRWSAAAALAYSLFSPSYDLFETIDKDRGLLPIPWRLHVMLKYGEGPHNFGLTLIPVALTAVWSAAYRSGPARVVLAALGLAMVALTHWIAALALAICCVIFLLIHVPWVGGSPREWPRHLHLRIALAGLLAYGMACFWLTPSFIHTVAFNWPKDAFGFKFLAQQQFALRLIAATVVVLILLFRKFPERRYLCFVTCAFFVFAALPESHYEFAIDPIPESRRYTLEMELFLALAAAEWLRVAWESRNAVNRFWVAVGVLLVMAGGVPQAWRYFSRGYAEWKLVPKEDTVEHRMARWLRDRYAAKNPLTAPGRAMVSGGLRFRLNSWFDLPQINGTFDSGLKNRAPVDIDYRFRSLKEVLPGNEVQDSVTMLQSLGVEYLVVHGPKSQEYYRDIQRPERFQNALEKIHDDGEDEIYRVPFRSLAHVIRPEQVAQSWQPFYSQAYVELVQSPNQPLLRVEWKGTSEIHIEGATVPAGGGVSVMVSHDDGWQAWQNGERFPTYRDGLGYLYVLLPSGAPVDLRLRYGPTTEKIICAAVSATVWIGVVFYLWKRRRILSSVGT